MIDELLAAAPDPTPAERAALDALAGFAARLGAERFQLAVVGQFKRGKSSLLNALLGMPVLPTGVLPLTASACFLSHAERPEMAVEIAGIETVRQAFDGADGLSRALVEYVTETGNPHNHKQVTRVEIGVPAHLLADGLVTIDTPGIGSAERHNTAAAIAMLPECDAALFVFSPDPPPSEAELEYLRAIMPHVALIMPVLTKADTVDAGNRQELLAYCRRVLGDAGVATEPSFVSAANGEGIAELIARIRAIGKSKRKQLLDTAIAGKAAAQIDELTFQNDAALAALTMPLDRLDTAAVKIDLAASQLAQHRHTEADLITGERARLARFQDKEAQTVAEGARRTLMSVLENSLARDAREMEAFAAVTSHMAGMFAEAFGKASMLQADRLATIVRSTEERLAPALEALRSGAADALGIEARVATSALELASPPAPAWRENEAQRMNPLPSGAFETIFPRAVRQRKILRRQAAEIDRLVTYNTERLRWTLRQSGDEALRRLVADVARTIDSAIVTTTDIVSRVRQQREDAAAALPSELERRRAWAALLNRARNCRGRGSETTVG